MTPASTSGTSSSPAPWWRKALRYVIPLVITVGLCYVLFTGINLGEIVDIIRRDCNFWWIGLGLVISIFSHIFRAMRWGIQLRALNVHASLWWLTLSVFGTYAVNLVFPRLGEVWRPGFIAERQHAPFTTVFGSMVADRLADTLTVLCLPVITFLLASPALLAFLERYPEVYQGIVKAIHSPFVWAAAVICIAGIWWFLRHKSDNRVVLKIKEFVNGLWQGFIVLFRMKGRGRWLLLTVAIWGCYYLQLYVAFFAFPFTREVLAEHGALAVLVCFVLSSIAMGIPANGGIGPWQIAVIFGLSIYMPSAIGPEGAEMFKVNSTAFANLVLGCQTLMVILLGIFTFTCISIDKRRHIRRIHQ